MLTGNCNYDIHLDVGCARGVFTAGTRVLAGVTLEVQVEGSATRDGVTLRGALLRVVRGKVGESKIAVAISSD